MKRNDFTVDFIISILEEAPPDALFGCSDQQIQRIWESHEQLRQLRVQLGGADESWERALIEVSQLTGVNVLELQSMGWSEFLRFMKAAARVRAVEREQVLVIHDEGYRSASWNGSSFQFTGAQAGVVKALAEANAPQPDKVLLEAASSDGDRLRDVFKSGRNVHPAWNTLILEHHKGWRELATKKVERSDKNPT